MEGAGAVEIPSYFLCPIALDLMRDPVTLSTGITYDRDSIERWVFAEKRGVCPLTKQPLGADVELTPNHTLRRLIQAWCTVNSSSAGVERIPTPRAPVDRAHVVEILEDARAPHSQLPALRKLKAVVAESERNKRCVEATPGALELLLSIIASYGSRASEEEAAAATADGFLPSCSGGACDEALDILSSLQVSEEILLGIVSTHAHMMESLTAILQRSNYKSRAYATLILKSLVEAMCTTSPDRLVGQSPEFYQEVLSVLRDRISVQVTKAALHVLVAVCPWGRNRVAAVEAGAVPAVVELLLEDPERQVSELALVALDLFCRCAEGRAELVGHAAGVPVVSKKVLRVSHLASEKAVRVLHSVARRSATPAVLREMAEVGVVSKLCLVLQADCTAKAKEKASEILRLHSRVWKSSPCLSSQLKLSYPSS